MPLHTTDALILRTYKLGESDRIVVFLTRDRGKKRGVAKNARQSRRRFGGALEPLTYGRVGYVERERRDLVRLDYVEVVRSPLGTLQVEFTVNDPKAYTKPWTVMLKQSFAVDTELVDEICLENEKSVQRMIGKPPG